MLAWLENELFLKVANYAIASSDASFRRYFRIKSDQGQFIVMDGPPDRENIAQFVKVADLLAACNVHVPTIFQQNCQEGFLLLEDLGTQCFLDKLNTDNADKIYQSAFESLIKLQTRVSVSTSYLPHYDKALLIRELTIFEEWFAGQLLGISLPPAIWQTACNLLVDSALEQPVCCVHRDFHSRNLMILDHDSPGVIDFQDAVIGPVTYDLVSLLRDCYISWTPEQVERWRNGHFQTLLQTGLVNCSPQQFKRWFDLMGMQRHLKAIGIFSRLHLRDSKSAYLDDIPRTLDYVIAQTKAYPEFVGLDEFLEQQVLPITRELL
jgi:aminoglycoside/choline kinase family phosphotransferase